MGAVLAYTPLTPAATLTRYRAERSPSLRNEIAIKNDGLAKEIARRWAGRCNVPFEDLLQVARIGLLKGIERYEPSRGYAFSSLVVPYIHGEIQHFLRDYAWDLGKVPRGAIEVNSKVRAIARRWAAKGRVVPLHKIAASLGIPGDRWREIEEITARHPVADLDSAALAAVPSGDEDRIVQLRRELARLPNPQRSALRLLYIEGRSPSDVAASLKLTPAELQQIAAAGLARLKTRMEAPDGC